MPKGAHQRIFISYARRDGADLARRLQKDLANAGFDVWLDTNRIAGGSVWTVEIEQAIDRAQVVLAILTPAAYSSEICRAEQLRSLRSRKCVIPVKGTTKTDIPLHLEAKNYRDFADEGAYQPSLHLLLADIRGGKGVVLQDRYRSTPDSYVTAPPQVANYVDRPEALHALRNTLFAADGHRAVAVTALEGMGGIGKSVLAQALLKDDVVRQAFPDGLVWITVGRAPIHDVTARLREVVEVLGGAASGAVSTETLYRTTIFEKAALIVLDDIWSKADLDPFLAESPRSRFLFTTRDASIARFSGACEHRVDLLDPPQARELLALWSGRTVADLPSAAGEILRECAGLPLALSTVGALLREAGRAEWADTAERLRNADLAAIEDQLPPGQASFFRAIDVSVNALSPNLQSCYERLAILLEDWRAPLPVLQTLWNVDEPGARLLMRQLINRSLAQQDGEDAIRLHNLQSDYVRARRPDRVTLELIRGALRLSAHVIERDPRQFASQVVGRLLPHGNDPLVREFIDTITAAAPRPWLRLLHPALQPPGTELIRTLEGHSDDVLAVALTRDGERAISASRDKSVRVWDLRTGRALHTLVGHTDAVTAVAVTTDGRQVISASRDKSLKLWDLRTGQALRTMEGHTGPINAVALSPDDKQALSASDDGTLRIWDLASGQTVGTLIGHFDGVTNVALTPDGKHAVSASIDGTVKVWDLATRQTLRTVTHSNRIRSMVVMPDGKRVVSASSYLQIWDLETGIELQVIRDDIYPLFGLAITADGHRAVSGTHDFELKFWDLETGRTLRTIDAHSLVITAVAVTLDGNRAISASRDHTLKVWDLQNEFPTKVVYAHPLVTAVAVTQNANWVVSASNFVRYWDVESGQIVGGTEYQPPAFNRLALTPDWKLAVALQMATFYVWEFNRGRFDRRRLLHTFEGHSGEVKSVALSANGMLAVSASTDGTLRVWDVGTGRSIRTLEGHLDYVNDVALTADGKLAVSASRDKTLKVWDLDSGRALRTLTGHHGAVAGVALAPNGRHAVSASTDGTLKVWKLDVAQSLRTLQGHSSSVTGVAIMANGRRAVSVSDDKTLKVWDIETARLVTTFSCDGGGTCCATSGDDLIVAGDMMGRVYFLRLVSDSS